MDGLKDLVHHGSMHRKDNIALPEDLPTPPPYLMGLLTTIFGYDTPGP